MRPRAVGQKIGTYINVVNQLLNSYTTNANIVKATSEITRLMQMLDASVVQFADAARLKAVWCGISYLIEWIKEVSIYGLQTAVCSAVCLFWVWELGTHLAEIDWYVDTLFVQQH